MEVGVKILCNITISYTQVSSIGAGWDKHLVQIKSKSVSELKTVAALVMLLLISSSLSRPRHIRNAWMKQQTSAAGKFRHKQQIISWVRAMPFPLLSYSLIIFPAVATFAINWHTKHFQSSSTNMFPSYHIPCISTNCVDYRTLISTQKQANALQHSNALRETWNICHEKN